jgi:hypothetical protein
VSRSTDWTTKTHTHTQHLSQTCSLPARGVYFLSLPAFVDPARESGRRFGRGRASEWTGESLVLHEASEMTCIRYRYKTLVGLELDRVSE